MKTSTACPFGATFTAPSVVPLYLGISETVGERRQARRLFPAQAAIPLLLLGISFCQLPGAAGIGVIRAHGALNVFDRGPGAARASSVLPWAMRTRAKRR